MLKLIFPLRASVAPFDSAIVATGNTGSRTDSGRKVVEGLDAICTFPVADFDREWLSINRATEHLSTRVGISAPHKQDPAAFLHIPPEQEPVSAYNGNQSSYHPCSIVRPFQHAVHLTDLFSGQV